MDTAYVIIRIPDGYFVAYPGSASAYTRDILKARVFSTREAAEAERCPENESIRPLRYYFREGYNAIR